MKKSLLLTAGLALIVGGCAEMETKPAASAAAAKAPAVNPELTAAFTEAEKEIAAAKKSGHLWNNTEKFMDAAKAAQADGKGDEAMKQVKKAVKEAKLAQEQAAREAGAKPTFPK